MILLSYMQDLECGCLSNCILVIFVISQFQVWLVLCLHIFFKGGSTAFKLHCCKTASCDIFFLSEGVKISGIYRRMFAQYGEHCMAQKNVYE
jgi:hypothetical protein